MVVIEAIPEIPNGVVFAGQAANNIVSSFWVSSLGRNLSKYRTPHPVPVCPFRRFGAHIEAIIRKANSVTLCIRMRVSTSRHPANSGVRIVSSVFMLRYCTLSGELDTS